MKRSVKANANRGAARDLFVELSEGMGALSDERHGKRTLRTRAVEFNQVPEALAQKPFEKIVEPIGQSFDQNESERNSTS